jgi:hypothetical protein
MNRQQRLQKHTTKHGVQGSIVKWRSILTVKKEELDLALEKGINIIGWEYERISPTQLRFLSEPNLVVDSGVQNSLDRNFGLPAGGTVITMGVDNGASNPVAGTTNSTAGSTSRRLVTFDSTPVRTGLQMSCIGVFTQATVNFIMKRLFLSTASAGTTDSADDLYAMTNVFTMDLTSFTTWSQTFEALVNGTGS